MASVLIVEDSPFVRELLKAVVFELGHDVVAESLDGKNAIEQIIMHQPEIVLLDLVLPQQNGLDVAAQIKDLFPQVKMIAVSSLDASWASQEALNSGCVSFVSKPFTKQKIEAVIAHALSSAATDSAGKLNYG